MDSHDIFRQLCAGTRFSKGKRAGPLGSAARVNSDYTDSKDSDGSSFEFLTNATNVENKCKMDDSYGEIKKISGEEMFGNIRKNNNISTLGANIPPPISTFRELVLLYNVPNQLVSNLESYRFANPTPIQMQAIPIMLEGRSLMACAPTGSGKTIAYLTPIISDLHQPKKVGFRAVVLAPTRELAQQIYRQCVRLSERTGLKIHIINKVSNNEKIFSSKSAKRQDILISTPNRIRYLLQVQPPVLDLQSVEWFVIDEADRLLEGGVNNFKEQVDVILTSCPKHSMKVALFSATYNSAVAKWALRNLKKLARVTVGEHNTATEHVEQELLFVGSESGKLLAMRDIIRDGLKPPVVVFVQSKVRAKQLFEELLYDGINVDVIHSDRTQQQRDNCVRAFREGAIWVLICTELMGRGIDFKGVNLVINYDFPPSSISYIHRIGRTGRAGRPGRAVTFFTQSDTPNLKSIAQIIQKAGGKVPDFILKMKKARKAIKKKLANCAPEREDISTKLRPEKVEKDKLNKATRIIKKKKNNNDNEKYEKILKKLKNTMGPINALLREDKVSRKNVNTKSKDATKKKKKSI